MKRKINSALISVYYKDNGLDNIMKKIHELNIKSFSTGGTADFIKGLDIPVTTVEELTKYPSILGGRVKTLHPLVFGGILARRDNEKDQVHVKEYKIPEIDLIIVDLYPFKETVASGALDADIIEKIDIGGISLIRAAAKNFNDVLIISSRSQYPALLKILEEQNGETTLEQRRKFATEAYDLSSHYDSAILNYFDVEKTSFKESIIGSYPLRYGENPHQKGRCYGDLNKVFDKLHGKEISFNNLGDVDAAVGLMNDIITKEKAFAIIKHANSCGFAIRQTLEEAYDDALSTDPTSAFGGIFITNAIVDKVTAEKITDIFYEVLIAPDYEEEALEILKSKKNRIILRLKKQVPAKLQYKSLPNLNVTVVQEIDSKVEVAEDLEWVTKRVPSVAERNDLLLANILVKHLKSNGIALVRDNMLISVGTGQTSRKDALEQAIEKARSFGFNVEGCVMASEAFFPFPDCVQIAHEAGIVAVIQPGGSVNDQKSIDYCDSVGKAMVFTGIRHFKH